MAIESAKSSLADSEAIKSMALGAPHTSHTKARAVANRHGNKLARESSLSVLPEPLRSKSLTVTSTTTMHDDREALLRDDASLLATRHRASSTNQVKSLLLFGLLFIDLLMNSSLEYDDYNSYPTMFGIQLFVELCSFVVVFLMLCETYPFRVGLIDALLAEFRAILWLHPFYFLFTTTLGLFRIINLPPQVAGNRGQFRKNNGMWDTTTAAGFRYTLVSHAHKLFAAFYYHSTVHATVRLGDAIYYEKKSWVSLFHRTGGARHQLRKELQRHR